MYRKLYEPYFINCHFKLKCQILLKPLQSSAPLLHFKNLSFLYFLCCPGDLGDTVDFSARRMGFSGNFLLMWSKGKFHSERKKRASFTDGNSFQELENLNKHCR
jgi:hypothetical protein